MSLSVLFGVCRLSVQLKKPTGAQRQECVALHKTLCLGCRSSPMRYVWKGHIQLERLPQTKDALELHLARSSFQTNVWLQADAAMQTVGVPSDTEGRQKIETQTLEVVWSSCPVIPDSCVELVTCGCKYKSRTASCSCSQSNQRCISACMCHANDFRNPEGL